MKTTIKLLKDWNGNTAGTILDQIDKPRAELLVSRAYAEFVEAEKPAPKKTETKKPAKKKPSK